MATTKWSAKKVRLGMVASVLLVTLLVSMVPVTPVLANTPPVVEPDYYTIDEDTVLNVVAPGVLGNDSDAESDPITAHKYTDPNFGTVVLNTNGSFVYTPRPNFSGVDEFTYWANDGVADSLGTTTVYITVETTEPPPSLQQGQVTLGDIMAPFDGEDVPISWGWELDADLGAYIFYGYDADTGWHYLMDAVECQEEIPSMRLDFHFPEIVHSIPYEGGYILWRGELELPVLTSISPHGGDEPEWFLLITAYDENSLTFTPLLGYDDGGLELMVPLDENQYLRQHFSLDDFSNSGISQVESVFVCWVPENPGFAGEIKLRDFNTGEAITVAGFSDPEGGWTKYGVLPVGFISDDFYVELWPTSGSAYLAADLDPPYHSMSEASVDGGTTWGVIGYPKPGIQIVDYFVRVTVVPPPIDSDGDGIADEVDSDPGIPSKNFSDSNTSGRVVNLDQGISILILDAPDPNGIRVLVSGPEDGIARIRIDGIQGTIELPPGEYIFTTSNVDNSVAMNIQRLQAKKSVKIRMDPLISKAVIDFEQKGKYKIGHGSLILGVSNEGLAKVKYSTDGFNIVVVVESGEEVILEEYIVNGELHAVIITAELGVINVNGIDITKGDGNTIWIPIDIKPSSETNSINLGSGGIVPVAILTTDTFDAANIDPTTVTLADAEVRVKGKSGNVGSLEDVDGDGDLDLLLQIFTDQLQPSYGAVVAVLKATTFDGYNILGADEIRIVP